MATISTSLRMFDMMSSPLQNITQALNLTISSMDQMNNATNRDLKLTNNLNAARNSIRQAEAGLNQLGEEQNRVANSQNKLNESFKNGSAATDGLLGKVKGLIGAYFGIQAARQGIESTIGGAMKMQQQLFTIQGIMGNKDIATAYFNHINDMANKSVFSLNDFAGSARKFMQFTKNTNSLDKLLNLNERLALVDPTQGFEGAGFALKEMMSGDGTSLKERFGFGKADIEILKASKDIGTFITQFDNLLNKKGFTESMLEQYNKSAAAQFDNLKSNIETSLAQAGNGALEKLAPILTNLNQTFNNGGFQGFFDGLSNGLAWTINLLIKLGYGIQSIGGFVQSNWAIIVPIIFGIIAALIVYNATMGIAWLTTLKDAGAKVMHTIASWAETAAIIAMTVAQDGLNAALAMCPITWIIIAIIALIAIFYAAVAAVNHFAGTSYSATGIILGAFAVAGAFIGNIIIAAINLIIDAFALIWNYIANFAEFFANVFNDPIGSIIRLFGGLADTVLQILEGIASAIDTLFGSNLASAVSGFNDSLQGWTDKVAGEAKIKVERMDSSSMHLNRLDYGNAWNGGYSVGQGVESYVGNMFSGFNLNSLPGDNNNGLNTDFNAWNQAQGPGNLSFGDDDKKNLKNINDKIDVSNEHLEMLRDMAEEKSIQNFTTLTPTVQVTTGDIREEADINKIISHIENYMENELQNSAEGLYA